MLQFKRVIVLGLFLVLAGCRKEAMVKQDDPFYAPVQPSHIAPPPATNGSLYQQNYSVALYGDRKGYRVGDVITILLTENTSSAKSTDSKLRKISEALVVNPKILGQTAPIDLSSGISSETAFQGKGQASQSNSLEGSITVTVHQLYPNGLMLVKGEKWLSLTNGSEVIRVSGLLRPEDVTPENTALSTKLADARLTYSGTGDLADTASQGWLTRFFNSSWWPF